MVRALVKFGVRMTFGLGLGYAYYRLTGGPPIKDVIKVYKTIKNERKFREMREDVIQGEGTVV